MSNTTRTSIIAIAALIIGGLIGYGYSTQLPISVTSTDVSVKTPVGDAALKDAKAGIYHLDGAASAVGKDNLDKAATELSDAKAQFTALKTVATDKTQPILVAQEAVIVHQFVPSKDFEAVGAAGTKSAGAADMLLTKGQSTKPLALSDYSISFGDLKVETEFANTHIDLAIEAAKNGDKAETAKQIKSARSAVTFTFADDTGD